MATTPQAWFESAQQHPGSWWDDWAQWAAALGRGKITARQPGAGKLPALEDAPGTYVKVKLAAA